MSEKKTPNKLANAKGTQKSGPPSTTVSAGGLPRWLVICVCSSAAFAAALIGVCLIATVVFVARPTMAPHTPNGTIDERNVKPSDHANVDLKDVQKTAESVISRMVELKRHRDNGFRMANETKLANDELQGVIGQQVEWRFSVMDVLADFGGSGGKVRFNCDWNTVDGERFPDFGDRDPVAGRLISHTVFTVRFNHPGRDLGIEKFYGRDTAFDTIDLIIGKEISREQALRLKPGDLVIIRGKIDVLNCSGAGIHCILTEVSSKE